MAGAVNMLIQLAVGLMVVGVLGSVSAKVVSDIGSSFTADSIEANITDNANTGQLNLSAQLGTIGTVGAILALVTILFDALGLSVADLVGFSSRRSMAAI